MGKILDSLKEQFKRKEILIQLITINVVIFIIISFLNIVKVLFKLESFNIAQYLGVSSSLEDMYQVWTWFTYMFVHESLWHILINMFVLYFSSKLFLFFLNSKQLGSLYILGGLGGALLYILAFNTIPYFQDLPHSYLVGASASVMGILFGVATYQPHFKVKLFFVIELKVIYLAVLLFVLDFLALTSENAGGHVAHIGGALVGILFGLLYLKGTDITAFITKIIDSIVNFVNKPKAKKKNEVRFKDRNTTYDNNARKKTSESEIDKILDKIKISGYASLTKDEKGKLFDASKK